MFGVEYHAKEQPKFASSLDAWKAWGIKKYYREICCRSSKIIIPKATGYVARQATPSTTE
jgi:hypothetical protein